MASLSEFLLGRSDFMPHGQCFAWEPGIVALQAASDLLIALAYFSIPMALLYFVNRRPDLEYKWMFGLFAAFITACGATHAFGVYVLWNPAYGLQGAIKAVTAVASVATAISLWFIMPKALALPGPRHLREVNAQLEHEIERQEAAQFELLRARNELEERVAARTADLEKANAELRDAKQRAEDADRSKSEFLANVSHELRTPLNSIIGFSELIKAEAMGPIGSNRYREYAEDINGAGQLLLEIISDILDISKIEAGRLTLEEEPMGLGAVASQSVAMVRDRAAEYGIEVSLEAEPDLPRLRADAVRLKQILLNLLSNAIKFIDGGGNVWVTIGSVANGDVQITVTDTGVGIAPEDLERITRPFVQASNATTRRHAGTGLGLALVKQLVEMHDGELTIDSRVGRGTVVRVRFPAMRTV